MKNIKIFAIGAVLTLGLASCSDNYFDVDMDQNKTSETAYTSAQDVKNGMIGAYYALGNYRFYGNYVVALGDMASDIATASSSTGHFFAINSYGITDTNDELDDIWNYGYIFRVIFCGGQRSSDNSSYTGTPSFDCQVFLCIFCREYYGVYGAFSGVYRIFCCGVQKYQCMGCNKPGIDNFGVAGNIYGSAYTNDILCTFFSGVDVSVKEY